MLDKVRELCTDRKYVEVYYDCGKRDYLSVIFHGFPIGTGAGHAGLRIDFMPNRFITVTLGKDFNWYTSLNNINMQQAVFSYNDSKGHMENLADEVITLIKFILDKHNNGEPRLSLEGVIDYAETAAELYRM